MRLQRFEIGQDAHALEDAEMRLPAEVDGVAAFAETGRTFDDCNVIAGAAEPEGEGGTGNAGAGDQDGAI